MTGGRMGSNLRTSFGLVGRIAVLVALLAAFPVILVVDLYLTPWRVPTRILYAIPIMVAARLFGTGVAIGVIVGAIAFSILDAWLAGIDVQAEVLSILALAVVGWLSLLWAQAERRAAALAEERARLHEQERHRAEELEESRARLVEFFSLVAHDLRSPLTAIGGYTQMLSRWDTLAPDQRGKVAEGIQASLRRVVRLSDDLLDAARIGAGRFEIRKEPCDLVTLAREIVEHKGPAAPNHHLILEARVDRLDGLFDCDRVAQALGNLVDNAIKYSPEGGEVRVVAERVGDRARVSVSDQGMGIAPEDLPRLFQPYARLRRTPGIKGVGLGLYIVKGIVEAHGGAIAVESQLGEGSSFTLDLPLRDRTDP